MGNGEDRNVLYSTQELLHENAQNQRSAPTLESVRRRTLALAQSGVLEDSKSPVLLLTGGRRKRKRKGHDRLVDEDLRIAKRRKKELARRRTPRNTSRQRRRGSGNNMRGSQQWKSTNQHVRQQSTHGYFEKRYLLVAYFLLDMMHHPKQYPVEPGVLDMWYNPMRLPVFFEKMRQYPRLVADLQASGLYSTVKFSQTAKITCNFRKRMSRYYERKSNGHTEQKSVDLRYGPIKSCRGNKKTNRPLGYRLNRLLFDKINIEETRELYKFHVFTEQRVRQHGTTEQMHTYERLHYGTYTQPDEREVLDGTLFVSPFAYFEAYRYFVYEMREAMTRFQSRYGMPIMEANVMQIADLNCEF